MIVKIDGIFQVSAGSLSLFFLIKTASDLSLVLGAFRDVQVCTLFYYDTSVHAFWFHSDGAYQIGMDRMGGIIFFADCLGTQGPR